MPLYNGNYVAPIWVNGVPPTVGESEMDLISGILQDSQTLKLNGAPTALTVGVVGQFCADMSTATPTLYRCYEVSNAGYIWRKAGEFGENLAQEYDSAATYAQGDYCIYDGGLYRALEDIDTAEAWTAAHWTSVKAADEVAAHVQDTSNPHEVTAAQVGLGNLTNDRQYSAENPALKLGTVSLSSSWSGSGGIYTQTITVTGAAVTANSHVELQFTPAQAETLADAWISQIFVTNNSGTLTATAVGGTTGAMTVQCTVEETKESNAFLTLRGSGTITLGLESTTPNWNGRLEYRTAGNAWQNWTGATITSGSDNCIYLRGGGNTVISGSASGTLGVSNAFVLTGPNIECIGNIETLLDCGEVAAGRHPMMGDTCFIGLFRNNTTLISAPELPATQCSSYCYSGMFNGCTALTTPPVLPANNLAPGCYSGMFRNCTSLTALPLLPGRYFSSYCYENMFRGCSLIKLSTTQDSTYTTEYNIPSSGASTGVTSGCFSNMFTGTGGSFAGSPDETVFVNRFYTSNTVIG